MAIAAVPGEPLHRLSVRWKQEADAAFPVAMDAVMADVTDLPGRPIGVADEFVLLGAQGSESITAADLAGARGTNSWEVVTDLAARLPRVYHAASVPRELRTLAGLHRAGEGSGDGAGGPRAGDRRSTRP